MALEFGQDAFDPVERDEDEADRLLGDRRAVAKLAHQSFGGVSQCLQPGQSEKSARALDRMHKAEDVAQNRFVVGLLLEPDQFNVDGVEMLARFSQKLTQKIVHDDGSNSLDATPIGTILAGRSFEFIERAANFP